MRQRTKDGIKRSVKTMARVVGTITRPRVPTTRILTYHSVGYRDHEMNVTPETFEAQMAWLAAHATVISLRDAAEGKPGVALTFDDGYRDNLTQAAPILQRFGFPATVFMVAGCAGTALTPGENPETGRLMTWDELITLASLGIEIGSHGMTHRRLSELSETEQAQEITGSKKLIEDHLGRPIRAFAYPYGSILDYSVTTFALVRTAGFRYAVSNRYGVVPPGTFPWELRRIWIDTTDSLASFAAKADGRLDLLTVLDSSLGIRLRRRLSRLIRENPQSAVHNPQ